MLNRSTTSVRRCHGRRERPVFAHLPSSRAPAADGSFGVVRVRVSRVVAGEEAGVICGGRLEAGGGWRSRPIGGCGQEELTSRERRRRVVLVREENEGGFGSCGRTVGGLR
ncbi:hypothetical protein PR202_gb27203 [Eleusine coracana subsp. coracana]|uniref:Uncharacterized protein n=1 Tax=Eleusine coracana subsp. coracana TaxID=191504 RepID=A0AAV5FUQ6_ELECO|nr:hypothetical protein PR202_gb27203 [Eleusine coracana subsp. coracana]